MRLTGDKIKQLDIVLEPVENAVVAGKNVIELVTNWDHSLQDKTTEEYDQAIDCLDLTLKLKATNSPVSLNFWEEMPLAARLKRNPDIVYLVVTLTDQTTIYIAMPWVSFDDDGDDNTLQAVYERDDEIIVKANLQVGEKSHPQFLQEELDNFKAELKQRMAEKN